MDRELVLDFDIGIDGTASALGSGAQLSIELQVGLDVEVKQIAMNFG